MQLETDMIICMCGIGCLTLTHEEGTEMGRTVETQKSCVFLCVCDSHSKWQSCASKGTTLEESFSCLIGLSSSGKMFRDRLHKDF